MASFKRQYIIPLLYLLLCGSRAGAQAEVIKHTYYTTTYDISLHYPLMVEWWATKARCACDEKLERTDKFAPDPEDPEHTNLGQAYLQINRHHKASPDTEHGDGKGYDRGHMCPAADNECMGTEALEECFYFSNMAPQTHALNAGDWKSLETYTRNLAIAYDSVHVWAGSTGVAETDGEINVPMQCWKVIYIKKTKKYEAYIFDNNFEAQHGKEWQAKWQVKLSDVQRLTHNKYKF